MQNRSLHKNIQCHVNLTKNIEHFWIKNFAKFFFKNVCFTFYVHVRRLSFYELSAKRDSKQSFLIFERFVQFVKIRNHFDRNIESHIFFKFMLSKLYFFLWIFSFRTWWTFQKFDTNKIARDSFWSWFVRWRRFRWNHDKTVEYNFFIVSIHEDVLWFKNQWIFRIYHHILIECQIYRSILIHFNVFRMIKIFLIFFFVEFMRFFRCIV